MASRIIPLTIISPGYSGVNKQSANNPSLGLEWAIDATNCVIDDSGKLAARKGWTKLTSSAISGTPNISALGEYIDIAGTSTIISAANLKIYSGTTTLTEITGTITTPTGNNWLFLNFNNKILGFQGGHTPIVKTSGNFANIVAGAGTLPTGHAALSAFGRVWAVKSTSDKTTLQWSDALLETTWSGGSSGTLDVKTVWGDGIDEITALASFQGHLVIFGKKSILIYSGAGVPSTMTLSDHIKGIGCIARDSVQDIGTDILFLSDSGVRSLGRTIQNETSPIGDVSINVRDYLISLVVSETANSIRSVYHEPEGFYLLNLPTANVTFCFDLKHSTDGSVPRVTIWNGINPKAMLSARNRSLYLGQAGVIGVYDDNYLDNTSTYLLTYRSVWTTLSDEIAALIKILKKVVINSTGGYGYTITFKYAFDYVDTYDSQSIALEIVGLGSGTGQYNISEYNVGEYGGNANLYSKARANLTKSGKVIKIGIDATINAQPLSISKIDLLIKTGRTSDT